MKLFHGTSGTAVPKILKHGIRARRFTKKSNWDKNPSHQDSIYLTTCYAGYFAHCAIKRGSVLGILEIETEGLEEFSFRPDEDFLDQAFAQGGSRVDKKLRDTLKGLTTQQRALWFRDNIDLFSGSWQASLEHLGNVSYQDSIPPEHITRAVTFDWKKNPAIGREFLEPLINIQNYKFCSQRYKALTAWLFGDPMNREDIYIFSTEALNLMPDDDNKKMFLENRKEFEKLLDDRSGITVLKG